MPFSKDNPGKGRPKNAPNKETKSLREHLNIILDGSRDDFQTTLNELRETNPKAFIDAYLRILEFSIPKLKSVDTQISAKDNIESIKIEIKKGTDFGN